MELMVRDGDYLPDGGGGYRRAGEGEELLQRVLWKLSIPRGSFPFLPELGSELYRLNHGTLPEEAGRAGAVRTSGRAWPGSMRPGPWLTSRPFRSPGCGWSGTGHWRWLWTGRAGPWR